MGSLGRTLALAAAVMTVSPSAFAQEPDAAERAYFRAVASFFDMPPAEVAILADWEIAPDDIPPILFVAAHAGVSPEALVALRRTGVGWGELLRRYRIGAPALHVPVRDHVPTGALGSAYEMYRRTPVGDWSSIRLGDSDVVALVNVRVIAQALGLSAEEVIRHTGSASSYVELFAQLSR